MSSHIKKLPTHVWYIKISDNYYIGPYHKYPAKNIYYSDAERVQFKIEEIKNE